MLARQLFPDGKDATPSDPFHYAEAVHQTRAWIDAGETVIFEAAFQHNRVLAAIDILVKHRGRWYAYEVKSSTEVKDYHLTDTALQYHVITQSGLPLQDMFVIHLNKSYVRQGELDLRALFTKESVKQSVLEAQAGMPARLEELKALLQKRTEPVTDIGPHCSDPFECEFTGHCWSHVPSPSVFDLTRLHTEKKFDLYQQGILHLEHLPVDYPLSDSQRLQVRGHLEGYLHIDTPAIRNWLSGLRYPLCYMDFETFMPGVPLYNGSRPYQQIPFQFSVHRQEKQQGDLVHHAWLGEPETDPRPDFIKELLSATTGKGSVLVYNKGFEDTRLRELQEDFPEHAAAIAHLRDRLVDLMVPFQQKWYYHPDMNGSYSIKQVLPALVPEMSYDDLEIGEGGTAMAAFEGILHITDPIQREHIRKSLLEYCGLDTLAMVKLLMQLITIS